MTARATILWAKAESDWLAGAASEALQTAEECRALPVTGFPTHILVEPVRQWAALDLHLDPGEPLSERPVPEPRRREQGVASDRRDVPGPGELEERGPVPRGRRRAGSACRAATRRAAGSARRRRPGARATPSVRSRSCACSSASCSRAVGGRCCGASTRCCACSASPFVRTRANAIPPLTAAQVEVLDLVGRGLDTHAIARRLVVSDATVETHVRQSMQRLGTPTRLAAAVELLRRRGDLSPEVHRGQQIAVGVDAPFAFPEDRHRSRRPTGRAVAVGSHDDREHRRAQRRRCRTRGDRRGARRFARARYRGIAPAGHAAPSSSTRVSRIGPLQRLDSVTPRVSVEADDTLRDALGVLANGGTVAEAAYAVHMSERTLHRRLSTLRKELGLRSNTAVARGSSAPASPELPRVLRSGRAPSRGSAGP